MVEATQLPIERVKPVFERTLAGPDPVVVVAPTGSGKSTRLPAWLNEACERPVLVVEPRRVACRALALWVAQSSGSALGEEVGYRVRFDDRAGPDTRVMFVTPGVALNMVASGTLWDFGAVLVDEFHERGWETDLLVTLLRQRAAPAPKLVVCSATLDVEDLVARLGARLVEAQGRAFPVEIVYRGDGPPSDRDLASRVKDAVSQALRDDREGDVLVFLPGKGEIERCGAALGPLGVQTIAVHGGVPPEKLTAAFDPSSSCRVFLATNVAETSLTLPGITTVVDSGLVRMRTHQAGRSVLAMVPVSGASAQQRAGRAGRVRPGRCVRLWVSHFEPDSVTPPQVERIELDDLVLRAASCGLVGAALEAAPWVTPPPSFALAAARRRLEAGGCLRPDGTPTTRGKDEAALPVSWLGTRILADAPRPLLGTLADLVALLEVGRELVLPQTSSEVSDARADLFRKAKDEVAVELIALRWGSVGEHGLHRGRLQEARRLARSLRQRLGAPLAADASDAVVPAELVPYLLRRIPQTAFVKRTRRQKGANRGGARRASEPWGNGEQELGLRPYVIPGVEPDVQPPAPKAGLVLEQEWLGVGRSAKGVGRMLLRCSFAELTDAGVGEQEFGPPTIERRSGKVRIVAPQRTVLATVVIAQQDGTLRSRPLCAALADLIVAGRLHRGLADELRDDLHLWGLVVGSTRARADDSAASVPDPPGELGDYLRDRMLGHGVETYEDFQLLEAQDLRPEVESMATELGVMPRELRALSDDFPRIWAFPGGRLLCQVDFSARQVVLEPEKLTIKGDPPSRFLPRFRGFRVEYRKASRRIRLR